MIDDNSIKINNIFLDISKTCNNMVKIVKKIDKIRKKEIKIITKDTDKSRASINIKKHISNKLANFMDIGEDSLISLP